MSREAHELTAADIMAYEDYALERGERRKKMTAIKKDRRVHIGPDATAYFENYDTMFHQIHEMLHIEKGGEEQLADELSAYNPLIPNGRELVATLMFEIDNENRRARLLASLGGVEETVSLHIAGEAIKAVPETDVDRTTADGKASSIQFLHFPLNDAQAERFKQAGEAVMVAIDHPQYSHTAKLAEATREALAGDLD